MKVVVQRTLSSSVTMNGETRSIGHGITVLFGSEQGDVMEDTVKLAEKTAGLRIFSDENDKMNLSARELGLQALVVPNFTLLADTKKGKRPSFIKSAEPEFAKTAFLRFCELLRDCGVPVKRGEFGADMRLELVNDGPVTIIMDTKEWKNEG